ncbi:class F sortase [Ornithinimicrobium sp. LYQ92]|uniref:class F sortase n=1 Tax=Serinicoccus sp. LYQ92 TaxID=3378798 RepID=UPI0038524FC6
MLLCLGGCAAPGPATGGPGDGQQGASPTVVEEPAAATTTPDIDTDTDTIDTAPRTGDAGQNDSAGGTEDGADGAAFVPQRLVVEDIGVDESLIDLGIAPDGAMEVPVDAADAGWFTPGGRPGGNGPTVIAGHVDSPTGGGVFARLTELEPGDRIQVMGADGEQLEYAVTEVGDHAKDTFPTERVFGATGRDTLRLITCTGLWDEGALSYVDNRVVYAEPVDDGA